MPRYKVTHGWIKMHDGEGGMKGVGEIVELDAEKGDAIVESGCAERVVEPTKQPSGGKKD